MRQRRARKLFIDEDKEKEREDCKTVNKQRAPERARETG